MILKKMIFMFQLCCTLQINCAQLPTMLSVEVAVEAGKLIAEIRSSSTYTPELEQKVFALRIRLLEHKGTQKALEQLNDAIKNLKAREEEQKQQHAMDLTHLAQDLLPVDVACAQLRIGNIYYTAQNYAEAFKCYKKAADQDVHQKEIEEIRVFLGDTYHYGRFVNKNYDEARKYYEKASQAADQKIRKYVQKKLNELAAKEKKETAINQLQSLAGQKT